METQAQRLAVLDGLRGIAIGLVVWYHLWQVSWLDPHLTIAGRFVPLIAIPVSGFLGVQLFFFLSAFCLTLPYAKAWFVQRPMPTLGHFAWRRFIKIVPSYLLSIIVLIGLGYVHWNDPYQMTSDLLAHLFFVHTYFEPSYSSINGVIWTLGIEVQFYVLFPLLVALLLRAPFSTAAVMCAIGVAYRVHIGECCRAPIFDHNLDQLLGFFDVFGIGMLAAYAYEWLRTNRLRLVEMQWVWTAVAFGAFCWIGAMFVNLEHARWEADFSNWWLIRNTFWFALAIGCATLASLFAHVAWRRLLANPLLVFLSIVSYNLYLWHQVVARWIATIPLPFHGKEPQGDLAWEYLAFFVSLTAMIAVSAAITFLFERPLLRRRPPRPFWPRPSPRRPPPAPASR